MDEQSRILTLKDPEKTSLSRSSYKKDMLYIGVLLALAILLLVGNFWWVSQQDKNDKAYIALAGELRIASQMLAKDAAHAVEGNADSFEALRESRDKFSQTLETLKEGDSGITLPATPVSIRDRELVGLEEVWYGVKNDTDTIIKRKDSLLSLYQETRILQSSVPKLEAESEDLLQNLVLLNLDANQIAMISHQSEIIERLLNNIETMISVVQSEVDAHTIDKETHFFSAVLNGLKHGDSDLKLTALSDPALLTKIDKLQKDFDVIKGNMNIILKTAADFSDVKTAAGEIFVSSKILLEKATALTNAYVKYSETRIVGPASAYVLAGICFMLLCGLAYRTYADTRVSLALSAAQNRGNQSAIARLLSELADLADGDLAVHATVSDDITGAIAESVNYAIDALRKLVFTINETAVQVSQAAQDAQGTSAQLADASENQAREIIAATAAINAMATAIEHVSTNASESAGVAERSVEIASNGVAVVQNTIGSMDRIREQIQETSKRIKRLGESSQEIGDTVSLIDDIADQTNILALNAAIQAAMAGEFGRGFAVVADEVQRLAERSSEATRQIDSLVKTIQLDTNEAMSSMEQSTSEVVKGARKAQDAGVALEKIENVSTHLSDIIQNISNASQQQAMASGKISKTMSIIQEITTQTASGTLATAGSIGNLAELAIELRNSVAGFNLPADHNESAL